MATVRLGNRNEGELNLWQELRTMADQHPSLDPETLLRLVTVNGARALGQAGKLGELSRGSRADLVVLPVSRPGRDPYSAALEHEGPASGVMINGRWAITPPGAGL